MRKIANQSFEFIEQKINNYAIKHPDTPLQAMLMYRMQVHMYQKMQDTRNQILKENNINETLFMALLIIDTQPDRVIQPSELSKSLGSSKTNATRVADELVKNGWLERYSLDHDRRCLFLKLTDTGIAFIEQIRPKQFANLAYVYAALDEEELHLYEQLSRKVLARIETL